MRVRAWCGRGIGAGVALVRAWHQKRQGAPCRAAPQRCMHKHQQINTSANNKYKHKYQCKCAYIYAPGYVFVAVVQLKA
jgi:hypothetical protein